MERISREELFMEIAETYSRRSTCLRGQVGSLIVLEGRPIAAGYNGAPPGMPHCLEVGCEVTISDFVPGDLVATKKGCIRAIHAEANAIAWSARFKGGAEGAEMYSTHSPCRACAQLIVSCGVKKFVYKENYRAERLDILEDCGLEVVKFGLA